MRLVHRTWQRFALLLVIVAVLTSLTSLTALARPEQPTVTVHGHLTLVEGDPAAESDLPDRQRWGVQTTDGEMVWLAGQPSIDPDLRNTLVTLSGTEGADGELFATDIASESATDAAQPEYAPATGTTHWVNLMCKFGDIADEKHSAAWMQDRFSTTAPGMTQYFSDVSYGTLTLAPVTTVGWLTLPSPRSTYIHNDEFGQWFDSGAALADCTAAADAQIDFTQYDGINLMFNADLDGYAWGGQWTIGLDGVERVYGVTWLPPFGYESHNVLAHEMGHAMGLQHSSGTYGQTYDSYWDLMSGGGTCSPYSAEWTCIGVHPIAYYKYLMGWVSDDRVSVVEGNATSSITLAPVSEPNSAGQLLAIIPLNGSDTTFLTLEARVQTGYDSGVPLEGVIIHRVDLSDGIQPARIVDVDQNGNPNDDGARWAVGETFVEAGSGVSFTVTGRDGASFTLSVTSDTAFNRTWNRTDRPVAAGAANRTWMWGPAPITAPLTEEYWDAPGGQRAVIYYEKSRMEITDPAADPTSAWYVTNGLLARELITGQLQLADDWFEPYAPSTSNVAGDQDDMNGPTYQTFAALLNRPAAADGAALNQRVSRDGVITTDASLTGYGATAAQRVTVPGLDHQVASPFWAFMNTTDVVFDNGEFNEDELFIDPYYATGLPITEAYWATVKVGGQSTDVLMQCFERRCLTWTPHNPTGWQVEAGNIGTHYYAWRQLVKGDE